MRLGLRSWADSGPGSIVEITKPRVEIGPKKWRSVAARLFPAGGEMLGQSRRKCARQVPDVTLVRLGPERIAAMRRKGSGAVKHRASTQMPPGFIVRLAASSRPDAGLRLSDDRPTPPHGENGGQTGPPSPATTRQRPGADRELTPIPGVSHPGPRFAIDDPSSPAAPGRSVTSWAKGHGRWLDADDANRHSSWLRRQPAVLALLSSAARHAHPARWD